MFLCWLKFVLSFVWPSWKKTSKQSRRSRLPRKGLYSLVMFVVRSLIQHFLFIRLKALYLYWLLGLIAVNEKGYSKKKKVWKNRFTSSYSIWVKGNDRLGELKWFWFGFITATMKQKWYCQFSRKETPQIKPDETFSMKVNLSENLGGFIREI